MNSKYLFNATINSSEETMKNALLFLLITTSGITTAQSQNRMAIGYDEGLSCRFLVNEALAIEGILHFQYLGEYITTDDQLLGNGSHLLTYDTTWSETDFGLGALASYAFVQRDQYKLQAFGQLSYFTDGAPQVNDLDTRKYLFFRAGLMPEFFFFDKNISLALKLGLEIVHRFETTTFFNATRLDTEAATTDVRLYGPRNPFSGTLLGIAVFFYL
jgi:hypothetical protein